MGVEYRKDRWGKRSHQPYPREEETVMLKISDIALPLNYQEEDIKRAASKRLGVSLEQILEITLNKRSVDARKKDQIHFNCTVEVKLSCPEEQILKRCRNKKVTLSVPYI